MRTMLIAVALAGCMTDLGDEQTSDLEQASNGETWSTVFNLPTDHVFDSIAISPTTHTIVVGGYGSDGGTRYSVWRNPISSSTFSRKDLGAGASVGALGADSTGAFFYVVNHVDNSGHGVVDVFKSANDGSSWASVYHATAGSVGPVSITIDGADHVFVMASIIDFFGANVHAILRSFDHGGSWQTAQEADPTQTDITALCIGRYHMQQAVFATAFTQATPQRVLAYVSVDAGITWIVNETAGTALGTNVGVGGCAGRASADEIVLATTRDGRWDARDVVWGGGRNDNLLTNPSLAAGAQFTGNRRYVFGSSGTSTDFANWRVRFSDDGVSWLDSENWHLTGGTKTAARAAAFDTTRGVYIAGLAVDSTGDEHGIVRHLDQ